MYQRDHRYMFSNTMNIFQCVVFVLMIVLPHVSVPQLVSTLLMTPLSDGRTLRIGWSPPRGDWDNYSVLLRDGLSVLVNQTISKLRTEHLFSLPSLVPGRLYGAEVTVHSGILGNTARCHRRLGEFTFTLSVF